MKISANRGKQNKIHILCDGEYSYTVDAEFWFSSPYYGIESIDDEEELAAFFEAVGSRCAFISALRLLSYHDYSNKEMADKLVLKGHDKNHALIAVKKLEEYGYINDKRYAEALVEGLLERKGMNINAIKKELFRKGISREIADDVTENLDFDPILRIIDLLNTKYSRKITSEKGIKQTVSALQRLGYRWSDINAAFRRLEIETEEIDDV